MNWMTCKVAAIQSIELSNNQITGSIPEAWSKQAMLRQITLGNNTAMTWVSFCCLLWLVHATCCQSSVDLSACLASVVPNDNLFSFYKNVCWGLWTSLMHVHTGTHYQLRMMLIWCRHGTACLHILLLKLCVCAVWFVDRGISSDLLATGH